MSTKSHCKKVAVNFTVTYWQLYFTWMSVSYCKSVYGITTVISFTVIQLYTTFPVWVPYFNLQK